MSLHHIWGLVPNIDDTLLSEDDAVVYLSHNVIYDDGWANMYIFYSIQFEIKKLD